MKRLIFATMLNLLFFGIVTALNMQAMACTGAPSPFAVSIDQPDINNANQTALSFTFTGATVGATYGYNLASSGGGTSQTGSGTITSAGQQITGIDSSSLPDGTLTLSVTLLYCGTASAGDTVVKDTAAPTRSSTSPADGATNVGVNENLIINFSENIVKGTGNIRIRKSADYSICETIDVTSTAVTVSGNSATIDPSITLASETGYYVIIDAGAFQDVNGYSFAGILSYSIWNFTTVDANPPSGYAVSIDQDYINNNNKTNMSFTFAGAEVGATYNYTLTSSGGGTPVTGSGDITSATQQVSGVTTFGLDEGTLTLSVTLTDISANTGAAVTDTVMKDTLMPNSYSAAIDQMVIYYANKTALSFVISGAEDGASYTYTISSSGGGGIPLDGSGTVSGNSKSVTGLDTSALTDGMLTLSVTMSDVAGNSGLEVTDTVLKDTMAPTGYSVHFDQTYVNNGNKTALSFAFAGAAVGASFNYAISSSGGGTPVTGSGIIASAMEALTALNVAGLEDGTLTVSATLTDAVGNMGLAATDTVVKDTVMPTGYTAVIDQTHINSHNMAAVSFTFTGAEVGTSYAYSLTSSGGGDAVKGSGTVDSAAQQVRDIDCSGLNDGAITLSVTLTDPGANTGEPTTDTKIKETVPPAITAFTINDNATETDSADVLLSMSALDAIQMRFSNDNGTWSGWEPYGTSKDWTIAAMGGDLATVYVQVRDEAENKACAFDNITSNVPTTTTTSIPGCNDNDGDGYGAGCSAGPDCNDNESLYTDVCPNCEVKIIPGTLNWILGDAAKTRTLLVIGTRGTVFDESTAVKWEPGAISLTGKPIVLFKRFMFMKVTIEGAAVEQGIYRCLIGTCSAQLTVK